MANSNLTGQWSEPQTLFSIYASRTAGANSSEMKK